MRRRIPAYLIAGLGALLLSACQKPATDENSVDKASRAQQADRMVVLSYNIHHGEGNDQVFDLPRLAEVIKNSGADLVALQEVDVLTKRAGGVNQAAELARLTGMYSAFGRAISYSGGEYGDAVLSKWPIRKTQIIPLPAQPHHEDRVAVVIHVESPVSGREIRFASTHFDHTSDPSDRIAQAEFLTAKLFPSELPTLVLGDLNAQPGSKPIEIMQRWTNAAAPDDMPTMSSTNPTRKIDWVLMSKSHNWQVREVYTIDEPVASDHLPLRAELELLR